MKRERLIQPRARVFCEIRFDDTKRALSIIGIEYGTCGQIVELVRTSEKRISANWTQEMIDRLCDVWDRWHLNDMRATCEHQRALGWTYATHPSAECLTCGYKLGHAWLHEDVPQDVIDWLFALPESSIPIPNGW